MINESQDPKPTPAKINPAPEVSFSVGVDPQRHMAVLELGVGDKRIRMHFEDNEVRDLCHMLIGAVERARALRPEAKAARGPIVSPTGRLLNELGVLPPAIKFPAR